MTDQQTPPDLVERVAEALANDIAAREIAEEVEAPQYDDMSALVQEYWRTIAKAALAALSQQEQER